MMTGKKIWWIRPEWVVGLHDLLLQKYGGDEGGGHRGACNEGAVAACEAVKNAYYDDIYDQAAAYAVYIIQGHVFLDANKRSGNATMALFLKLNNASTIYDFDPADMIELQARAEDGERTDSLVVWLSRKLRPPGLSRGRRRR